MTREVKESLLSRKCQTLQCAGLVVTPKLAASQYWRVIWGNGVHH
jgi:hypothetical protein